MGGVAAASSEPDVMREGSRERRSMRSEVEGSLKMPIIESGLRWSLPLLYFPSSSVETESREGEGNREKLLARLRFRVAMGITTVTGRREKGDKINIDLGGI